MLQPHAELVNVFPVFWLLVWFLFYAGYISADPIYLGGDTSNNSTERFSGDINTTQFRSVVMKPDLFAINEPTLCSGYSKVFLMVFVCTAVNHTSQRHVIRQTWASVTYGRNNLSDGYVEGVQVVFLIGEVPHAMRRSHGNQTNLQESIEHESRQYGDLIQADFVDVYTNLSLKSLIMLRWASDYCQSAKYILKVDDDTFVDIETLTINLRFTENHNFIMGRLISGARPFHNQSSKYYTPTKAYPDATYPQYVSGSAYVISSDIIKRLLHTCLRTELFWLEDVYLTGMCARSARVSLIHNSRFNSFAPPTLGIQFAQGLSASSLFDCRKHKWISLHKQTEEQMFLTWQLLHKKCN